MDLFQCGVSASLLLVLPPVFTLTMFLDTSTCPADVPAKLAVGLKRVTTKTVLVKGKLFYGGV